jgi:cell division protein FtsW
LIDRLLKIKIKGDGIIWMVFFFLCIISIVEVYSSSSTLTFKSGSYYGPVLRHTGLLLVGVLFMIITMNIKCKYFKIVTPFALVISLAMLIVVLMMGQSTNGAARWIGLFGIQFQPSELAKGALILAEAQILSAMQTEIGADRRAFKFIFWLSLPYVMLIAVENLSTAMLICITIFLMMFIGRVPKSQLNRTIGVVVLLAAVGIGLIMLLGSQESKENLNNEKMVLTEKQPTPEKTSSLNKVFHRFGTWQARFQKFLNNEEISPEQYDLDKDAQVAHANIAIASSNIVGKGPGNSVERDFLSQAFSDFIYAIIIEEMGIWGASFVCLLYIILLFRTATIANRCANAFPALLIMGIALMLTIQAFFNMMVAVGLAPVTGQPLPLISRGGTSTIMNCIYIGIILSVSYWAKKKDDADRKNDVRQALATA